MNDKPTSQHTFNVAAMETLNESIKICEQRAGEYLDSWSLENLRTPYLDSIWNRLFPMSEEFKFPKAIKRLIIMASMCDIKLSRMSGSFREDTYIDLNNYNSAFCALRKEYEQLIKNDNNSNTISTAVGDFHT